MKLVEQTTMEKVEDMNGQTIQTTIGDLICAIRDAVKETSMEDAELTKLTHLVLMDMLARRK